MRAIALVHVLAEDLGTLEPELLRRGFTIEIVQAAKTTFPNPELESCDLLVVLGGPIGVYDAADYPFLNGEIAAIRARLKSRKPTLGICLGAQLIASALGARVYPGANGAEIGWYTIQTANFASTPDWFAPLLQNGLRLFHWHGDTFDLPTGARQLASTNSYQNQAFAIGDYALGLQFHPEVTAQGLEAWYVAHACELHQKELSIPKLREDARKYAPGLQQAARLFWKLWLSSIL